MVWRFPNEYLRESQSGSNRSNPYLSAAYTDRKYNRYKLFPTIYAKFSLPFGIKLTSRMTTRMDFYNKYSFYDGDNPSWSESSASRNHSTTFEWQWDNILSWNKIFGKHSFDVTGLINSEDAKAWSTTSGTTDFSPTDALGYHGMSLGMTSTAGSTDTDVSRDAIMGRINYGYDGRYNISASIRRDGCSKFGSNNKRATFPSFSAAWNITKEEFMFGKPEWLSFLKLRTSWGMNGNSAGIDDYQSYAVLASKKYLTYDDGYVNTAYTYIDTFADPDLEWEKTASWNFGIDYGLWDGRIRGAVDFYSSKTTDLLLEKSLPIINGLTSTTTNVGSLKNKGIDLSISTINIESSFLKWNSQLNISWNKNKIISLTGEEYEVTDENGNTYMKEYDDTDNGWFIGKSKDVIYDYENDGVYQEGEEDEAIIYGLHPGDFKIVDQNNDGILNSDDKVFQGVNNNPWYITLRNDVEYKDFDFGIIFLAKLGYKGGSNLPFNNAEDYIKNHNWYDIPYWTEDNPINNAARINSTNTVGANIWRNKSYLRCQNISLGYNFVPYFLKSLNIKSARLAFNIDNAFIITDWAYGDPESMFEMPRTYSLNLNFSF